MLSEVVCALGTAQSKDLHFHLPTGSVQVIAPAMLTSYL